MNFFKSAPLIAWLKIFRGTKSSQWGRLVWLCELICNYFLKYYNSCEINYEQVQALGDFLDTWALFPLSVKKKKLVKKGLCLRYRKRIWNKILSYEVV